MGMEVTHRLPLPSTAGSLRLERSFMCSTSVSLTQQGHFQSCITLPVPSRASDWTWDVSTPCMGPADEYLHGQLGGHVTSAVSFESDAVMRLKVS